RIATSLRSGKQSEPGRRAVCDWLLKRSRADLRRGSRAMRNAHASIVKLIAALALLSPAAAGADTGRARVYLLCSARGPAAAGSSGKLYRSAIFSVPAGEAGDAGATATMASKAFQTY